MDGKEYNLATIMQTHFISSKMSLNNNSSTKFKRLKYEPITIREPHKYDIKTFDDPNDFTSYYREHEDEFKGVSTLVLNRTYKIPGYRISVSKRGTENEELTLRKDYYSSTVETNNSPDDRIPELIARIENIEQFLEQLRV
jgi:hypothetical protein